MDLATDGGVFVFAGVLMYKSNRNTVQLHNVAMIAGHIFTSAAKPCVLVMQRFNCSPLGTKGTGPLTPISILFYSFGVFKLDLKFYSSKPS